MNRIRLGFLAELDSLIFGAGFLGRAFTAIVQVHLHGWGICLLFRCWTARTRL